MSWRRVEDLGEDDEGGGVPRMARYSQEVGFTSAEAKEQGKYYYALDRIDETHALTNLEVNELYAEGRLPTVGALVASCKQEGFETQEEHDESPGNTCVWNLGKEAYQKNWFQKGDWAEYLSLDMTWKLAQVRRVIAQAPDDWDYDENDGKEPPADEQEIFYSFLQQGLVHEDLVRAPKQGLERLFGSAPWLWQQHCLLLLERRLRFQADHEYDFAEVDIQRFADKRFDAWLENPKNAAFKEHYDRQTPIAKSLLASHLLTPFELMDRITEDDEIWDFDDTDISVYTYTSVLGSGCSVFLIALMIQLMGIFVLLINGIQTEDGEENERFFFGDDNLEYNFLVFELASTNLTLLCRGEGVGNTRAGLEGKILLFLVIVMYLFQIVPDNAQRFFRVAGAYESCHSRINSLREVIYKQADDSMLQQIGYKVDRYMNTAFVCVVYMVLLFILFNTPNVLDIILNALAVEFLHEIDEKLADAKWWDGQNRWICAGTQQLVIQGTLRLQILESVDRTCAEFDIDKDVWREVLGNNFGPLKDRRVAKRDDQLEDYMSKKERLWKKFADYARKSGNFQAYKHFKKPIEQFGVLEYMFYLAGIYRMGQFHKQIDYRTWSRWDEVLYLARIPKDVEVEMELGAIDSKHSRDDLDKEIRHVERSDLIEFAIQFARVFFLVDAVEMFVLSVQVGNYYELPWRIFDAILEWVSYVIQILFPFYVMVALILFPYCY